MLYHRFIGILLVIERDFQGLLSFLQLHNLQSFRFKPTELSPPDQTHKQARAPPFTLLQHI